MKSRRSEAKRAAQVALKTWNGGGFGDSYFEGHGRRVVDAVESALSRDALMTSKSVRRALVESLAVIAVGGLAMWPFAEIIVRAGLAWAVFGMLIAVAWGGLMGYLLRDAK